MKKEINSLKGLDRILALVMAFSIGFLPSIAHSADAWRALIPTTLVETGVSVDTDGNLLAGSSITTTGAFFGDGSQLTGVTATPSGSAGGDLTGTYPNPTLANLVVDTAELVDGSVTTAKLESDAVTNAKIITDAVDARAIAADAVGSSEIATDAVGSAEIAANAVDSSEIATGAVTTGKLGTDAVTSVKILNGAVTTNKILNGSVSEAKLDFNTATQAELDTHEALSGSSAHSATSANTASQIVTRDGSGNFSAGTITAALSGNATTATALAANGANCSPGSAPLGVDASGAVESCTDFIGTGGGESIAGNLSIGATSLEFRGAANTATICASTCAGGKGRCMYVSTDHAETVIATGTLVNQWILGGSRVGLCG